MSITERRCMIKNCRDPVEGTDFYCVKHRKEVNQKHYQKHREELLAKANARARSLKTKKKKPK
jgi:hypothetical protein